MLQGRTTHAACACRIARSEDGFTVIELLISFALLTLALGAIATVLETSQTQAAASVERQNAIQEAETGLYRMTRELRQGQIPAGATLPTAPGDQLDLVVGGKRVVYDCTVASGPYHACVRYTTTTLAARPGPGCAACVNLTTDKVIDRLTNGLSPGASGGAVFTPNSASSPTRYDVTIQVPSKGEKQSGTESHVTFNDAIYLRNANVPATALGSYQGGQ